MADFDNSMDRLEPQDPEIEYAYHSWNQDIHFYGIGSTTPPKDYSAAMSLWLVVMIFFSGLFTVFGLLDIKFELQSVTEQDDVHIYFVQEEGTVPDGLEQSGQEERSDSPVMETLPAGESDPALELSGSEESVENHADKAGALSWQEVYEKVIPSVVSLTCTAQEETVWGSGVIMSQSGYILTNAHLVEDAFEIQVLLSDGRTFEAKVKGTDEITNLAVIQIEAEGLTAAEFGDSTALRVGDQVVAIGDPLGIEYRGIMTEGIVSGIFTQCQVGNRNMTLLRTTADQMDGNSGGPLVNCYGQVVAINTVEYADEDLEGMGFCVPTDTIAAVVEELVTQGYVSGRPSLGVEGEMLSVFYQHYYRLPSGLLITDIDDDSDAARKGLRTGDIILAVNDTTIGDLGTFQKIIFDCRVGDQVTVTIYRGGREYDFSVAIVEDQE